MTTFAPSATKRVIETYISAGVQHTVTFRRARSEGVSAALTAARATFEQVVLALASQLPDDFAWVTEEYILEDEEIRHPSGWTGPGSIVGDVDVTTLTAIEKITGTTFQGKGSGGSKCRFTIYGTSWDQHTVGADAANGRVTVGEDAGVAAVVTTLNGGTPTYAIDNTIATFYAYANVKVNDHLLALVRKGSIT